MSRKLAEEQAAANGGQVSNAALGGYIWPVDSHYITSTFGGRASPGGIGSTNHKGVDIGRVGYTTTVHAAKAGTVIVAQRSSSYGNYVVISHGSGNTTLYGHMSSLKVSSGTYVNQGDAIGITGSTGHSTGPHLHFEISENGVRINPLNYLTGYTLAG
jgi:murein DD-endopeptidase MepM/ murein hydrolase activator NlpD